MVEEKKYTEKELTAIMIAMRERQETLEALECARIVMTETKQYPRFIYKIDHIIKSIEDAGQPIIEPQEEKQEIDLFEEPVDKPSIDKLPVLDNKKKIK